MHHLNLVRDGVRSVKKYVVNLRRIVRIVPNGIALIGRVADYRIELLSHSRCLAFQCGELERLAVLPVIYYAEGDRFLRLLFFGLFGCPVRKHVVEYVEKRRLHWLRLGLLERPQGRLHLGAHLVGGHGVGKAVHLPEVP